MEHNIISYVGMVQFLNGRHINKCINVTFWKYALYYLPASVSHISHSQVLLWTTEPLMSLESVAEVSDWLVTKMGKLSILSLTDWPVDWPTDYTLAQQLQNNPLQHATQTQTCSCTPLFLHAYKTIV